MHPTHARYLCFLTRRRVQDRRSFLHFTLIDPNPGKLPVLGLFELEGQAHKRKFIVDFHEDLFLVFFQVKGIVGDLGRIRQIIDDAIEQVLYSFVLESGAHEDRAEVKVDGVLADTVF